MLSILILLQLAAAVDILYKTKTDVFPAAEGQPSPFVLLVPDDITLGSDLFVSLVPHIKGLIIDGDQISVRIDDEAGCITSADVVNILGYIQREIIDAKALTVCDGTALELLWVSNIPIDNGIPACISKLTNLKSLKLSNLGLKGDVPTAVWDLPNLEQLDLSSNLLVGTVPKTFLEREVGGQKVLNISCNSCLIVAPYTGTAEVINSTDCAEPENTCVVTTETVNVCNVLLNEEQLPEAVSKMIEPVNLDCILQSDEFKTFVQDVKTRMAENKLEMGGCGTYGLLVTEEELPYLEQAISKLMAAVNQHYGDILKQGDNLCQVVVTLTSLPTD